MDKRPTCDVYPGVTVKAGDNTTFNCSVYKAVPPGELRWRMDGDIVSTGGNSSTRQSERSVIEGDSFLAECAVVDSNPEGENIRWFDADGDVVGTGERLEFNTVHKNQTDDAYTCMSSVSFYDGSQGNGSTVFTISVQYLSDVDVQYDDNGTVVEGDTFQATCTADANPDPEFIWIGQDENEVSRGYLLMLHDVKPDDSGMYTCYANVTFWNGSFRMENASFELDVQFSPRMDRNVTGDASDGGKVIEGDSFAVECLVLDANPDHNDDIQWFDDEMNRVGADEWLIFDQVDKSEAGNYTCTATNTFFNGGVGDGETSITIDVQYLYDVVIHEDSDGKVKKGDTYRAHCSAEANPTADIAWVDADGETVVDGSTLVFDDAQLSDAGLYVCRGDVVFWDLTPKSSSDSVLLDVQYISDVVIHFENYGTVIEGHKYYANCTADANPTAVISWTTPDGDVTFTEELAKEDARRADSGNYTCTAKVTYWDGTVEVTQTGFYLDVQYQPEVTIIDQSNGKSIEGDRYDAVCQVESNPDSDVVWLDPDDNVVASSPQLTFDAIRVENSGTYTCQASNTFWDGSIGTRNATIFIDVQYISDAVVFSENDGTVIEGRPFYANCSVEANPIAEMSWLTPFQNTIVGDILHIDKTSRTDSGNYTCVGSVTFWNGTVDESRSTILLGVQYSPNVDIEQASGGKVLEGERFIAECTAEANPDPDTVWQDPNGLVISFDNTLVIDNTRLEDGGVHTCLANNTFWDGSVGSGNSTIFVDVQYLTDAVINYGSGGRVIEGQTYYANCSADANPAAEIWWRKADGETILSEYVEIDEADKTDGGNYTCIATTAFWDGTEGQSESSFYLDVQYISDVHIYEENEGKVIEGQGFYANCSSDANPTAVIAWRTPTGGSIDGAELMIEQAERTDGGSYVCTASTTYWDGSSDQSESDVFVDVQYLHEISIFNENDGKVIEGQTYYANCSADSNPTADISWLTPDGGQTPGEELQLEQASRTDSGDYRCTATVTYWDKTEVSDEKSVIVDVQCENSLTFLLFTLNVYLAITSR
ncbi:basement membrane-specific heparan sulfate proteoglycan core protein-like [Ptychodera flava]|uniref:basement membrane-specific heparan sulfate proteoglycan core protein-like n=1 Tax=Ptychodera flava TaxID=63121 RepID=UPI00396A6BD6